MKIFALIWLALMVWSYPRWSYKQWYLRLKRELGGEP